MFSLLQVLTDTPHFTSHLTLCSYCKQLRITKHTNKNPQKYKNQNNQKTNEKMCQNKTKSLQKLKQNIEGVVCFSTSYEHW